MIETLSKAIRFTGIFAAFAHLASGASRALRDAHAKITEGKSS
jgi:hypothetical protein